MLRIAKIAARLSESCIHDSETLCFTTIFSFGSVVAVEHSLQYGPSTPEDQPTWWVIAFSVLMTAKTRQRIEELVDCQSLANGPITPNAEHFDIVGDSCYAILRSGSTDETNANDENGLRAASEGVHLLQRAAKDLSAVD